jgi:hypothetical protein
MQFIRNFFIGDPSEIEAPFLSYKQENEDECVEQERQQRREILRREYCGKVSFYGWEGIYTVHEKTLIVSLVYPEVAKIKLTISDLLDDKTCESGLRLCAEHYNLPKTTFKERATLAKICVQDTARFFCECLADNSPSCEIVSSRKETAICYEDMITGAVHNRLGRLEKKVDPKKAFTSKVPPTW